MSLSHPHWKVSRTSASLVWEISKQLKVFSCFPYQILICYFSIWWKEQRQQLITYYKLIELFLVESLINLRKNCHFWCCSISNSFVWICYIYLENSVLNFYFSLTSKKRYPFIFLHISLYLSYKISHHLLYALELEYASFYYWRKCSPKMFVVKNWYSI